MNLATPQTGDGEVVLSEAVMRDLEGLRSNKAELEEALVAIADLVKPKNTENDHALGQQPNTAGLVGWRTRRFGKGNKRRIIYRFSPAASGLETPLIEVLCLGKKNLGDDRLYGYASDAAAAFGPTAEIADMWASLNRIDTAAHEIGLPEWDLAPDPSTRAPYRARDRASAVEWGVVSSAHEPFVSDAEIDEAVAATDDFEQYRIGEAVRDSGNMTLPRPQFPGLGAVIEQRSGTRCGKWMPRARKTCMRPEHHDGTPCRSDPAGYAGRR